MLSLHKKKHGINFYTVWFATEPFRKPGIVAYYEYAGKKPDVTCSDFETLITDLTETEEEIKQHFSKSCKYKVNRATREDVQCTILDSDKITDEELTDFGDFFASFWESKGTSLSDKEKLLQDLKVYRKAGALTLAYARVNGEKAIYHTHIADDTTARLLHSASLYRLQKDEEGNTKNLIGMANRLLHFEEMKHFKKQGKTRYDWGGAGHTEDVIHITEFKESFGGAPAVYYSFEQANGLMAQLFKLAVKILRK
ncbi:MAG: hypothetical protein J6C63_06960 [Lachnospiraceae bacterium]|nr:hypothetical protein [Lachnospiraceae bacterium]